MCGTGSVSQHTSSYYKHDVFLLQVWVQVAHKTPSKATRLLFYGSLLVNHTGSLNLAGEWDFPFDLLEQISGSCGVVCFALFAAVAAFKTDS